MELSREEMAKHLKDDLLMLYKVIVKEVYTPKQFYEMLDRDGAVECSRNLLNTKTLSYGFEKLYLAKRLELTLENFILKCPVYHIFFTESMLNNAKKKMKDLEFDVNGNKLETFAKTYPQYKVHHLDTVLELG